MGTELPAPRELRNTRWRLELAGSILMTLVACVVTGYAAVTHTAILIAPGSGFLLFGGAWIGNVLARGDVPLIPKVEPKVSEEKR
jgi:hypothetical protein